MKNYLKLLISLFSTSAIISCGTQKSTETTTTTETTKPTEETSGGGGGVTPNAGGWPSLDKLPISGSLGASKTSFFNDRAMEGRFNTWKEKKDDFAKAIYATSSQGQSDLEDYYKGSKDDWFASDASTVAYNTWKGGAGKAALTTLWKTTADYRTKKAAHVAGGTSTKRSKATWLGLAASDASYNTWRAKRTDNLKSAWEATTTGATSYTTKFNTYKTGHATDTKEKYADLAASNNDYNTWRVKRETALKTAWEATNDYTSSARAEYSVDDYIADDISHVSTYLTNLVGNTRRATISLRILHGTTTHSTGFAGDLRSIYRTFLNYANSGKYRKGGAGDPDWAIAESVTTNTAFMNKWNEMITDFEADSGTGATSLKTDVIHLYKQLSVSATTGRIADTSYHTWADTEYKADTTAYNRDLDGWSATKANGLATYKLSTDLTSDYATWIEAQYKASTTYNTDLDAWSATKANGQSAYNAHADSATDYGNWTDPNQRTNDTYDANHLGHFDRDLGHWTSTKANGKATYFADATSNTDFNAYVNPSPNKVNEYLQSTEFTNNFNSFVTNSLTWTAYKDFFIKQKYNSEAFKKLYYNYLLDQ